MQLRPIVPTFLIHLNMTLYQYSDYLYKRELYVLWLLFLHIYIIIHHHTPFAALTFITAALTFITVASTFTVHVFVVQVFFLKQFLCLIQRHITLWNILRKCSPSPPSSHCCSEKWFDTYGWTIMRWFLWLCSGCHVHSSLLVEVLFI